jgi:hypothetical protein
MDYTGTMRTLNDALCIIDGLANEESEHWSPKMREIWKACGGMLAVTLYQAEEELKANQRIEGAKRMIERISE